MRATASDSPTPIHASITAVAGVRLFRPEYTTHRPSLTSQQTLRFRAERLLTPVASRPLGGSVVYKWADASDFHNKTMM